MAADWPCAQAVTGSVGNGVYGCTGAEGPHGGRCDWNPVPVDSGAARCQTFDNHRARQLLRGLSGAPGVLLGCRPEPMPSLISRAKTVLVDMPRHGKLAYCLVRDKRVPRAPK